MNAIDQVADLTDLPIIEEAGKHHILIVDPKTGEERKIELTPENEFSQEAEIDYPETIH